MLSYVVYFVLATGQYVLPATETYPHLNACVQQSELAVVQWTTLHPGQKVTKWVCVEARRLPEEVIGDPA